MGEFISYFCSQLSYQLKKDQLEVVNLVLASPSKRGTLAFPCHFCEGLEPYLGLYWSNHWRNPFLMSHCLSLRLHCLPFRRWFVAGFFLCSNYYSPKGLSPPMAFLLRGECNCGRFWSSNRIWWPRDRSLNWRRGPLLRRFLDHTQDIDSSWWSLGW